MAEGNFKVVVVGGAGGIGQPLALQVSRNRRMTRLQRHIYIKF
jgi:malate/lactate dehydrogenase